MRSWFGIRYARGGMVHGGAVPSVLRSESHDGLVQLGRNGQRTFPRLVRPLPETIGGVHLKIFPQALEERVANLAFGGLGAVLDLGEQLRLDSDTFVRDALFWNLSLSCLELLQCVPLLSNYARPSLLYKHDENKIVRLNLPLTMPKETSISAPTSPKSCQNVVARFRSAPR
jgi:hypothetical protein